MNFDQFDTSRFKEQLETEWLGSDFIYREETDSTNTDLKKIAAERISHGTVLLTDAQWKGRGQYDRKWVSEPGKNLTFTIALRPGHPERLPLLTLASAYGVIDALKIYYNDNKANQQELFCLKWPNDILKKGRKLAGILTESIFNGNELERVLIGIGLNVNQDSFPGELEHATSLFRLYGSQQPREDLLCAILKNIEYNYRRWQKFDKNLIKDINRVIEGFNSWGTIKVNEEVYPGKVKLLGINEKGHLLILTADFEVKTFTHEQVKFRRDHTDG